MTEKHIEQVIINKLSKSKFDEIKNTDSYNSDELYIRKDAEMLGLPNYSNSKPGYILRINDAGNDVEWTNEVLGKAIGFESLEEMVNSLNGELKGTYDKFQTIYIAEEDVPDFWIYSVEDTAVVGTLPDKSDPNAFKEQFFQFGYYKLSQLEPTKLVVNSNITYSETQPQNPYIGDLWLTPTSAEFYDLPAYDATTTGKHLGVDGNGNLEWQDTSSSLTEAVVDQKINTAISAIKDSAPEAFDTLKEISDWIASDETGTAALTQRIEVLENKDVSVDAMDVLAVVNGSDHIIVDLNEAGTAVDVRLDQEILTSINGKQDSATAYNTSNVVFGETEPAAPVQGMLWIKPTQATDLSEAVLTTEQTLTEEQKAQARANIGAISADEAGGGSGLPEVSTADNGKILRVVDGAWAIVALTNAEEVAF